MGGRRARSVYEIVGTGRGITARAGQLSDAIADQDADALVTTSAKLVAASSKVDDILYYASKLIPFIKRVVKATRRELSFEERQKLARKEWSRIKRQEKIQDNPIVTQAIVSAAAQAIGKKKE